ncbi:hypothetical protein FB451DRAFT_1415077 [Mycena latifolia]|nr:hypothetical protein FB451DRAFT_1415077 [Mycena latifolia]
MTLIWGIAKTDTDPGVPGIFELTGMHENLRSKPTAVDLNQMVAGDGSYNLASTHGEGEGHGAFMPAVQTNTPQATVIIKEVLQILHQLYRLIMPLCMSRFEWDMMEFNGIENNVIAFANVLNIRLPEPDGSEDLPPPLLYDAEDPVPPESSIELSDLLGGIMNQILAKHGVKAEFRN